MVTLAQRPVPWKRNKSARPVLQVHVLTLTCDAQTPGLPGQYPLLLSLPYGPHCPGVSQYATRSPGLASQAGVGTDVGAGVGTGVSTGVGSGVGSTAGTGVGPGGVGSGVGPGVGAGVGSGEQT
jgi:hypothetical protein